MYGVTCRAEFQLQDLPSFLGKSVGIGLRGSGHAYGTRQCAVVPKFHCSRNYRRIIGGEVECAFLVLPRLDDRDGVSRPGEYAPVRVDNLGAYEGCAAAAFEDVEVDALAAERKTVLLHLGDHLNGMAPYRQPGHVEVKVAVGGAAPCNRVEVALHTVDIQYYGFRAGTGHSIGYLYFVMKVISTLGESGGHVVAA